VEIKSVLRDTETKIPYEVDILWNGILCHWRWDAGTNLPHLVSREYFSGDGYVSKFRLAEMRKIVMAIFKGK